MSSSVPRRFSFAPGPGPLPAPVMARAQREFLAIPAVDGTGSSSSSSSSSDAAAAAAGDGSAGFGPLELTNLDVAGGTHPGVPAPATPAQGVMHAAEQKLRALLRIPGPDEYRVLFVHGGAVGQFSSVPMNLGWLGEATATATAAAAAGGDGDVGSSFRFGKADYVNAGFWSTRAMAEAAKYVDVHECAKTAADGSLPPASEWDVRPDAAYVHVTLNETVQGAEYRAESLGWGADKPPLVADATSTLLSRPINVAEYGVVYASGGKNVPAGVTVIIVRTSLLKERKAHPLTPQVMDYRMQGGGLMPEPSIFESRPNTPPIFATYMLDLVLDHIQETFDGDLAKVAKWVDGRAQRIYDVVDADTDGFYSCKVPKDSRSHMSAVFRIRDGDKALEAKFAADAAEQAGLHFLFGHSVAGGCRVTLYIGIPDEAVDAVVDFMQTWKAANDK